MLTGLYSDPQDRPTANRLLGQPFCFHNPHYNFFDTDLYAKINTGSTSGLGVQNQI
jgi:hypothetical protein